MSRAKQGPSYPLVVMGGELGWGGQVSERIGVRPRTAEKSPQPCNCGASIMQSIILWSSEGKIVDHG